MPPQIRGFGAGPGVGGPFHQPGFPSHGQHQGGPLGANQYLNSNAQMSPFSSNGGAFGAGGLNGAGSGFGDTGFGSQSARMGFAHGPAASMQQAQHGAQTQHNVLREHPSMRAQPNKGRIREVWKHNLHEEMAVLRDVVEKYPYVAMVSTQPALSEVCSANVTTGHRVSRCCGETNGWLPGEE